MGGQVVHDHGIAGRRFRRQDMGHVGADGVVVDRPVEQHRGARAIETQADGDAGGLPRGMGHAGAAMLASRDPSPQPGQLGRGAGLIDENELRGIEIGQAVGPSLAAGRDIRPLLLGGVRGLFEADPAMVEEIPNRRRTGRHGLLLGRALGDLHQIDVRPLSHRRQNEILMGIQLRAARLALLVRPGLCRLAIAPIPRHRRRKPTRNRLNHPNPKVCTVAL